MSWPLLALARIRPLARLSTRRFATASNNSYLAELDAVREHAAHSTDMWRKISFYVCVPATIICSVWVSRVESEHAAHVEHIKAENGGELPKTPEYDYLNRRARPFPWGHNSLFFNPRTNKDMSTASEE